MREPEMTCWTPNDESNFRWGWIYAAIVFVVGAPAVAVCLL